MASDHFRSAIKSLGHRKIHSLITIFGITMGVSVISFFLIISDSTSNNISSRLQRFDHHFASISIDTSSGFRANSFNQKDLEICRDNQEIINASPIASFKIKLSTKDTKPMQSTIIGTSSNFINLFELNIKNGNFIDDTDSNSIVLPMRLAIELFGNDQIIGNYITLGNEKFTVTGVTQPTSEFSNVDGIDLGNSPIISINSAKKLNSGISQFQDIFLSIKHSPQTTVSQISTEILKNHQDEINLVSKVDNELIKFNNQNIIKFESSGFVGAIVAIFVGGISIMNALLLNVAERIREIGLRKALGATSWQIAKQFLVEGIMLSLIGGTIGYLIGLLGSFVLGTFFLDFSMAIQWQLPLCITLLSIIVGIIFSAYPSIKASRQDPIKSLRQYY